MGNQKFNKGAYEITDHVFIWLLIKNITQPLVLNYNLLDIWLEIDIKSDTFEKSGNQNTWYAFDDYLIDKVKLGEWMCDEDVKVDILLYDIFLRLRS